MPDAGLARDASSARRDAAASDAASDARGDGGDLDGGRASERERVFGVTLTDPWALDSAEGDLVIERLRGLTAPSRVGPESWPTVRVVFDEGVDEVRRSGGATARDYIGPLERLVGTAQVMGELLDSFFVADYSADELRQRACEYRAELGHLVDLWEVGNEINGEWLGDDAPRKLATAAAVFLASPSEFAALCPGRSVRDDERPFRVAMTLYGNGTYDGGRSSATNCWSDPDHAMLRWAQTQFGPGGALEASGAALDYVWVSYYEDDCDGIQPDWPGVFAELGRLFPGARLGFGECGSERRARKEPLLRRYYEGMTLPDPELANMHIPEPNFVGGMFWWYFSDDLHDDALYSRFVQARRNAFWR